MTDEKVIKHINDMLCGKIILSLGWGGLVCVSIKENPTKCNGNRLNHDVHCRFRSTKTSDLVEW